MIATPARTFGATPSLRMGFVVMLFVLMIPCAWCQHGAIFLTDTSAMFPVDVDKWRKSVLAEIEECTEKLGSPNYKQRRSATRKLLQIASRDKADRYNYKARTYLVCEKLAELFSHEDPEVAERAKDVVRKTGILDHFNLGNLAKLTHVVDPKNDTILKIANTYKSNTVLIIGANPGLRTNADLQKRHTIVVPYKERDPEDALHEYEGMVIEIE